MRLLWLLSGQEAMQRERQITARQNSEETQRRREEEGRRNG